MALSDDELTELLRDMESDRVERKESGQAADKIGQALCAFANDLAGHRAPGVLFVGVRDDGSDAGLPITDRLLQNLAAIRDQGNLLPPPTMTVSKRRLNGIDIAVVEVAPSKAPPVRYRGQVWVRVGPRRGVANADDERVLNERRRSLDVPFDAQPVTGATRDDLDLDLFRTTVLPALVPASVLAENGRDIDQRLAALRMTGPDGVPTTAGILVAGRDPQSWIPGSYVQFLRIDGLALSDPIVDEKRIDGPLPTVMRNLEELLLLNVRSSVDFTSTATELRHPDYPISALQQVVRNAVMHRSYESTNAPVRVTWYRDRVEVVSPGGLFGIMAAAGIESGMTDYRNPTLAEFMRGMGYVQRFGAGIPVTVKALAENGNPPAEFNTEAPFVSVVLRSRS